MFNKSEFKYTLKENPNDKRTIKVGGVTIGETPLLCSGPCTIANEEELIKIAKEVKNAGCNALRGGAFKPRTSPYSFQGLGSDGIKILSEISKDFNLLSTSEITDPRDVDLFNQHIDIIQVGARNMQNFVLLSELGKIDKPIILKRGFSATITEFLSSSEYIIEGGNEKVILCERGIRTFNEITRNTLDLGTVALIQEYSSLPIIVDPSHASGLRSLVPKLALASMVMGVDGLMIESHTNPDEAISDKEQTISTETLKDLIIKINAFKKI
ncbi:MAG: 3-deoxy-7-phosphoheptulonate synthase [Lachnospirales bacterium]